MMRWEKMRWKARMRKISFIKYKMYKEFKKPKISYICDKTLVFSSIYNKCRSEDEKYLKKNQLKY